MRRIFRGALVLAFVLATGLPAQAGGIAVEPMHLAQFTETDGYAAVVKPLALKKRILEAKVLICFDGRGSRATCKANSVQNFRLFALPDDLRGDEWIQIHRYWNYCEPCRNPGNPKVILIKTSSGFFDPLKNTPHNIRLARLVGRAQWKKAYAKGTSLAQAQKDLNDPDLFFLAYPLLAKAKKITDSLLFLAASKIEKPARFEEFNPVLHHLKTLSGKKHEAFRSRTIAAVARGKRHPRMLQAVMRMLTPVKMKDLDRARQLLRTLRYEERAEQKVIDQLVYYVIDLLRSKKAKGQAAKLKPLCQEMRAQKSQYKRSVLKYCQKLFGQ